jgi:hypothetical protein
MDIKSYQKKYNKYKFKYIELKNKALINIIGGSSLSNNNTDECNGVWTELPKELYVIGDIHGDFFTLKQSLELTKCVIFDTYNEKLKYNTITNSYSLSDGCEYYAKEKNNVKWNPNKKNIFIVFAGDIVDRCRPHNIVNPDCINTINDENCDYKIFELLMELDVQARKYNSRVIIVLGNHELLNIKNDIRYVSNKGKADINRMDNLIKLLNNNINNIFGIVRINRYIIAHGGVNDLFFDEVNKIFINKRIANPKIESIAIYNSYIRKYILGEVNNNADNILNLLHLNISPFWDRTIGGMDSLNENQCKKIFEDNILNIKHLSNDTKIIVAHCPQFLFLKNINLVDCQEYKNKIYRIDIAMSRAFDSYKLNDELKEVLASINTSNILSTKYKNFYNYNEDNTRAVGILKIVGNTEELLTGQLTIDYFNKLAFKNNKDILRYLLSDLKKIIVTNIDILKDDYQLDNFEKSRDKIDELLKYLHTLS